jgi:hypothetical protein
MSELIEGQPLDANQTAANNQQFENQQNNSPATQEEITPKRTSASLFDTRVNLYPDAPILNGSGGYTVPNGDGKFNSISDQPNSGGTKAIGPPSIMTTHLIDENGNSTGFGYSITSLAGKGTTHFEIGTKNELLHDTGARPWYDIENHAKEPTTANIINWSQEHDKFKSRPYKFTDFVFCKYWNKIPNNYMITLRRFAYPVWDNMEFPGQNGDASGGGNGAQFYLPISTAVTYMGEATGNALSNILKFGAKVNWKDLEAKVHEVSQQAPGADGGPAPGLAKVLGVLTGGTDFNKIANNGATPPDPYANGPYMNHVLGPVNRIDKVKTRDAGLEFSQDFTLVFEYVARPIDGVNTKAVMLDILANLLLMTYAEAAFWGGSHRFTGGSPAYPFLGGAAGMKAWYAGDGPGFFDAVADQFAGAAKELGSIFSGLLEGNAIDGLKSLAAGGAKLGIAQQLAGKKVQMQGLPALLSGAPVGEWHLVVGNPFNPTLMIGNLICSNLDVEFGEELGPDDFPLEMKATIKLEHAMARDKASIESMFNRGKGKIYTLPDELQKMFDTSGAGQAGGKTDNNSNARTSGGDKVSGKSSTQRKSILRGDPNDFDRVVKGASRFPQEIKAAFSYGLGHNNQ